MPFFIVRKNLEIQRWLQRAREKLPHTSGLCRTAPTCKLLREGRTASCSPGRTVQKPRTPHRYKTTLLWSRGLSKPCSLLPEGRARLDCFRVFMEGALQSSTQPPRARLPIDRRSEQQLPGQEQAPIPTSRDSRRAEEAGGRVFLLCRPEAGPGSHFH